VLLEDEMEKNKEAFRKEVEFIEEDYIIKLCDAIPDDKKALIEKYFKSKKGSMCPKCKRLFLEKKDECLACRVATAPIIYFTTLRVERVIFCFVVSLIIGGIVMLITKNLKYGFEVLMASLIIIPSAFFAGNFLFGYGGGFKEIYLAEALPSGSELSFSWPKFFSEFVTLFIIFVLMTIVVALGKLFKWLF